MNDFSGHSYAPQFNREQSAFSALNPRYILISVAAVFFSFVLHELSHWLMGEALGYKMGMTLNAAYPLSGIMNSEQDKYLVSAAGPAFTILQALVFYILLLRGRSLFLYPLLFTPLYMRLLAGVMNVFVLNDEGHISQSVGIGTYTLSIMICLLIGLMVYHVSKRRQLTKKFQLINFFFTMVFTSALILLNQYLGIKLIT